MIDFAAFYVTSWKFAPDDTPSERKTDPCPGNDNDRLSSYPGLGSRPAQVGGYFIQCVEPGGGAVDPERHVLELTRHSKPCRAVLVR